jgi:hypothetical protein
MSLGSTTVTFRSGGASSCGEPAMQCVHNCVHCGLCSGDLGLSLGKSHVLPLELTARHPGVPLSGMERTGITSHFRRATHVPSTPPPLPSVRQHLSER